MHVAYEVGFDDDPKTLVFCARVRNPLAGIYLLRWRRFVLLHADLKKNRSGSHDAVVTGYTPAEIALTCGWNGKPTAFIQALKAARALEVRGKALLYPEWSKTTTGRYAEDREWDRDRKKEERAARRTARLASIRSGGAPDASVDVPRTSGGRPPDIHRTSGVNKEGSPPGGSPPGAPPEGGVVEAAALWEWFEKVHPRVRNPDVCKRFLAALTDSEIAHLRYSLPRQAVSSTWNKNPRFRPWSDNYLRKQQWLEIKLPRPAEPEQAREPDPELLKREEAQKAEREAEADRRVAEMTLFSEIKKRLAASGLEGDELMRQVDEEFERRRGELHVPPRLEVVK